MTCSVESDILWIYPCDVTRATRTFVSICVNIDFWILLEAQQFWLNWTNKTVECFSSKNCYSPPQMLLVHETEIRATVDLLFKKKIRKNWKEPTMRLWSIESIGAHWREGRRRRSIDYFSWPSARPKYYFGKYFVNRRPLSPLRTTFPALTSFC